MIASLIVVCLLAVPLVLLAAELARGRRTAAPVRAVRREHRHGRRRAA